MAEANGLPGYPFVVVSHPIADNDDATLRDKAERAVDQLVALLVERGRSVDGGAVAARAGAPEGREAR